MTETAGFYNSVGFNDDTRAFLSIPARHDVARRIDCGVLAALVAEHRLEEWEAAELASVFSYNFVKAAYNLLGFRRERLRRHRFLRPVLSGSAALRGSFTSVFVPFTAPI